MKDNRTVGELLESYGMNEANDKSAVSFIKKSDGNIFQAASLKQPMKPIAGNIHKKKYDF